MTQSSASSNGSASRFSSSVSISSQRPSLWFLGPTLTAFLLHAQAHRDVVWAALCVTVIVSVYVSPIRGAWPRRRTDLFRCLMVMAALWLLAYLYFELALEEGRRLPYFPRFVMKPWFISTSSMWVGLLLVWLWHIPFPPQGRGAGIYMMTGWIALSSCQFLSLSSVFRGTLVLYCASVAVAMIMTGFGHETHGTRWWPRPKQWLFYGTWLAVLGLGTWWMIGGLHQLQEQLPRFLGQFFRPPSFSGQMGSRDVMMIRRQQNIKLSAELVAAISGSREPGYIRTQVMTRYKQGMWSSPRHDWPLSGHTQQKTLVFSLHTSPSSASTHSPLSAPSTSLSMNPPPSLPSSKDSTMPRLLYQVQTFRHLDGSVLLSYGTQRFLTQPGVRCVRRMGHSLSCEPEERLGQYRYERMKTPRLPVGTGEAGLPGSANLELLREQQRKKTDTLSQHAKIRRHQEKQALQAVYQQLRPLAVQVVGNAIDQPLLAAQRVQDFFRRNYTYSLQVDLAKQGDPTVDFVLNRRPAFCEYFASGMALMLQSLGIASRVATGFLVQEFHPLSRRWLVRQRDAHAWTEVYDAQHRRWIAYDATAPDMLMRPPASGIRGLWDNLWSWVQLRWQEWIVWMRHVNVREWLTQQFSVIIEVLWTWKTAAAILALWLLLELWQQRQRCWTWLLRILRIRPSVSGKTTDNTDIPIQEEVSQHLQQILQYWAEQGWPIAAHETLEEYSVRLQQVRQMASSETSGSSASPDTPVLSQTIAHLEELQTLIPLYNGLRFISEDPNHTAPTRLQRWREWIQSRAFQ